MRTTTLIPRRVATTGITVLGAAGIATAALTGTAHAQAPAKPAEKVLSADSATAAEHVATQAAHAKAAKGGKKAEGYPDNLDGWIREAMSIMKKHGIPGSYDGIKRNIIR
ncbi:phage tail tape measure protein, partial [Streptomyces albus]